MDRYGNASKKIVRYGFLFVLIKPVLRTGVRACVCGRDWKHELLGFERMCVCERER